MDRGIGGKAEGLKERKVGKLPLPLVGGYNLASDGPLGGAPMVTEELGLCWRV
jgi:hypothetical protein